MENSGIPLWFRCFKGIDDPDAFNLSIITEGISYVNNLFKDKESKRVIYTNEELSIVKYKESIFTRIKDWLKRILFL